MSSRYGHFKVARETGSVPVSKGTMGLFWGTLSILLSVSTFVKLRKNLVEKWLNIAAAYQDAPTTGEIHQI